MTHHDRSTRRAVLGGAALAALAVTRPAWTQATRIKIGVLTDMSGNTQDLSGTTSVAAVRQAAAEFMAATPSIPIEVVVADHQNKPDLGAALARAWFDSDGVDVVVDLPNSAVALAVSTVAVEKDKVCIPTSSASSVMTGSACTPNMVQWAQDTWSIANSGAKFLVESGGRSWFVVVGNFAFGKAFLADTTRAVEKAGGKVIADAAFPVGETTDFSAYIVQAQGSGAEVVCFGFGGRDMINALKQANEFGLQRSKRLAAPTAYINDVVGAGLDVAQGIIVCEQFYWDLNDRTRGWYQRLKPKLTNKVPPNGFQAGSYAGTMHYLKTVKAMGVAAAKESGRRVVATMKQIPTDDDCFGVGSIRQDGRAMHATYLFKVKSPDQSKSADDVYAPLATIDSEHSFRPLAEGGCPILKL